jgi:GAF domain-containing protein
MEEMRHCGALYDVAAAVNSALEPGSVLETIVQKTATAMGVKGCSIMLLNPDRSQLHHSAHYGLSDRYVQKGPIRMDPALIEPLQGRSATVLDASTDPQIQYRPEAIREGIVSMLSVPIRLRGEVIGVMRVYTAEQQQFTREDVEFVEAVANLGAIALENASRYAEAKVDLESLRSYVYRYGGT